MEGFKYYSTKTLKRHVGTTVEWITLNGTIKSAVLVNAGSRTSLPESGGVYADTVPVRLLQSSEA